MKTFQAFLIEEVTAESSALKKVKRLIGHANREWKKDKSMFELDYKFLAPSKVEVTLTIKQFLSDNPHDKKTFEYFEDDLKSMAEDVKIGDAHKVEDGDSFYAGDILQAIAGDTIKQKGSISWENLLSQVQLILTFTVPG